MTLGMPSGRARIAAVPIAVPAPPPIAITASMRPFGEELRNGLAGAVGHGRDRAAAVGFSGERLDVDSRGGGHRRPGDRRGERRLTHHADVDDDRSMAPFARSGP